METPISSTEKSGGMQKKMLEKYVDAVMHAPASLGLTATHDAHEFWERHVLDALKVLEHVPSELQKKTIKALDVGSGNGIPGIPIAIALPHWSISLLDSNNKKAGFIDMFCKFNDVQNVAVTADRAEVMAHHPEWRGAYDLVFARALSKLPTTLELCIPFLKVDGLLIVPHGTSYQDELAKSQNSLHELGAELDKAVPYTVTSNLNFIVLLFHKYKETPAHYPRKSGVPKKSPL